MDKAVVRHIKILWALIGLCVTGVAFLGWDFPTAAATALLFVGVSVLAPVAFFLYLLLGDTHVALRVPLIALFLIGLVVEVCAVASLFGWQ